MLLQVNPEKSENFKERWMDCDCPKMAGLFPSLNNSLWHELANVCSVEKAFAMKGFSLHRGVR